MTGRGENMGVKTALDEVVSAMTDLQVTESHCVNKRGNLTKAERQEWEKATTRYRDALFGAVEVLLQEIREIRNA